ncbi:MAG: hypothetical protein R3C45_21270 [Phycisphaerales bacterium]
MPSSCERREQPARGACADDQQVEYVTVRDSAFTVRVLFPASSDRVRDGDALSPPSAPPQNR